MRFRAEGAEFKVTFHHSRPPVEKKKKFPKINILVDGIGVDVTHLLERTETLTGHTGAPSNGVTTATLWVKMQGPPEIMRGDFRPLAYAQASCSVKDQFCKLTGRMISFYRLARGARGRFPAVVEEMEAVGREEGIR